MIDVLTVALFIIFVAFMNAEQRLQQLLVIARDVGLRCDGTPIEECLKKPLQELKEFRDEKAKKDARDRGGKGICSIVNPETGATGKFPIAEAAIRLEGVSFRPLSTGQNILAPRHRKAAIYSPKEFMSEFDQYLMKDCAYGIELSECRKDAEQMTGAQMGETYRAVEHAFLKMKKRSNSDLCK